MSTAASRASDEAPLSTSVVVQDGVPYQTGFANSFESEAVQGSLPRGRNNPRLVPLDLYTEQLSGTAFTAPRSTNRRVWLYRRLPSVVGTHHALQEYSLLKYFGHADPSQDFVVDPNPLRWKPPVMTTHATHTNFVTGLHTYSMSGSPLDKNGLSISLYTFTQNMNHQHLYNSDGDFLIVPQQGSLLIYTEMGRIIVHPGEISVIPRGVVFSVHRYKVQEEYARGYVLEVFKGHFQLPELGLIGSNGLVNVRDVYHPTAWYDGVSSEPCTILNKFGGQLFARASSHSPYNVVAWHGNYVPFKYDLSKFCAVNSVSFDHLDPSIYTVLTVVGNGESGTALADFVIFPPRILATDSNTFRPPWFHRNTMSEFMGLISGSYDAKVEFVPGGATLHPTMTPHGPDAVSYQKAVQDECKQPTKFEGGLAFMFETSCLMKLSRYALSCPHRDLEYARCWAELPDVFGTKGGKGD